MDNQRRRSRVTGHFEATISWEGKTIPIVTENISQKGLLCEVPQGLGIRMLDPCVVTLTLSTDIVLRIEAKAMRVEDGRLALLFEAMDVETFRHLRNVVRYSASDPDAIDRELAQLLADGC